jgi:hypothetical protein
MQKKINNESQIDAVCMQDVNKAASTISKMSGLSNQIEEFKKAVLYVIENSPDDSLHSNELKKIF